MSEEGYFLIALGERYIDECCNLAITLKKQKDERPIALLIHKKDLNYAQEKKIFDEFIFFEPNINCNLWKLCKNYFEKYCLYPRFHLNDYIPYKYSITVDSDVLCQYSPNQIWNFLKYKKNPIQMIGRKKDLNWQCGKLQQVIDAVGSHIPHVHGGFIYLKNNSSELKNFFDYLKNIAFKYDEYRCPRGYATPDGMVDEILFAIAHSHFNLQPIDFDEFPIMTFNYSSSITIPSTLQTENNQNINMQTPIPFIHMFDKINGKNYQSIFKKIINL